MKKIIKFVFLLALCSVLAFTVTGCAKEADPNNRITYDEAALKEYIESFDEEIAGDGLIIVVLTDEASQRTNDYTVNDFSQIKAVDIEHLPSIGFLFITIADTDRESVLRACYILRLRSDVQSAEPNVINEGTANRGNS